MFLSIGVGAVPFGRIGATSAGLSRSLLSGCVSTSYRSAVVDHDVRLAPASCLPRIPRCACCGANCQAVPGMRLPFLLPSVVLMNGWLMMSAGFRDAGDTTLNCGNPLTKFVTRTR